MKRSLFALLSFINSLTAQDTSLHEYLSDDQPWKEVAGGFAFTDGLCCDAAGNLFFTDVKAGKGIYKLDTATGKTELFLDNLPGISGLQVGPDGRFYACHNKEQRIIAANLELGYTYQYRKTETFGVIVRDSSRVLLFRPAI